MARRIAALQVVPTRFVRLGKLKAHRAFPRFGSASGFKHPLTGEPNTNLCEPREAFDPAKTCFVFVSHRWLKPGNGAAGHPDNERRDKFQLVISALEKMCGGVSTPVPAGIEVAVWMDYCCIDQDGAPASELDNLGNLMAGCDLVLTPVVDPEHARWAYPPGDWKDPFAQYLAPGWQEYWKRGWCRVEAMLAAVKPVTEGRAALFRGAMSAALQAHRRPHALFGTKELEGRLAPFFMPPLLHAHFETYAPERGKLTKASDRAAVTKLSDEARGELVELQLGFVGEYQGDGDGEGRHHGADGSVFEGQFKRGKPHGRGRSTSADGGVYDGEWVDGAMHGHGLYVYGSGDQYEGAWHRGDMHGHGRYVSAGGDVYEGEFRESKRHGQGRYQMNGRTYEGAWRAGVQHGRGRQIKPNGAVSHDGEWRDGSPVLAHRRRSGVDLTK